MRHRFDFTWVRIVVGILVYVAMLGLVTVATYELVSGPQRLGLAEAWPLVFYFVVAYFGTVLLGLGISFAIQVGPGLLRRVP